MENKDGEQIALFEHRFWLQILGDHSRFIFNALLPAEEEEVRRSQQFILLFDRLLEQAHRTLTGNEVDMLSRQAYEGAQDIRRFKLHLLRRHLAEKIAIQLPPSFLGHMVNEVEEYIRIANFLAKGQTPPLCSPVHHHLLWLLDAAGHAAGLIGSLDEAEKDLLRRSREFNKHFEELYRKALEVCGYLRTNLCRFPALSRLNHQAELEILMFKEFLEELEELKLSNQLLGTMSPLLPDHMNREECYYLIKLAQVSEIQAPACDPAEPRVEE